MKISSFNFELYCYRNYGPTIFSQKVAQAKGCQQCLWLYKDEVSQKVLQKIYIYITFSVIVSSKYVKLFVSPFSLITLRNLKKYFIFLGDKNEIKEFIIVIKISVLIDLKNKMSQNGFDDSLLINPLSTNPTKWSNTLDELSECVLLFCGVGA